MRVTIVLAACLAAAGSAPVGATPLLLPVLTVDGEPVPVASFDCGEVTVQGAGVTLSAIRCTGSDFTSASGSWTLEAPAVMFHEDFAHVLLGGSFSLRNDADTAHTFDISLSLAVSPGDDRGISRRGLSGWLSDLDGDGASLRPLPLAIGASPRWPSNGRSHASARHASRRSLRTHEAFDRDGVPAP